MQKKSLFFFSFPSESNFDEVKVRINVQYIYYLLCLFHFFVANTVYNSIKKTHL